jgi:hypothetical protein
MATTLRRNLYRLFAIISTSSQWLLDIVARGRKLFERLQVSTTIQASSADGTKTALEPVSKFGGVTEWFMVTVLKTVFASGERGFESHPLRQIGSRQYENPRVPA